MNKDDRNEKQINEIKSHLSTLSDKELFEKLEEFNSFLGEENSIADKSNDVRIKILNSIYIIKIINIFNEELDRRKLIIKERMEEAYKNLSDEEKEILRSASIESW